MYIVLKSKVAHPHTSQRAQCASPLHHEAPWTAEPAGCSETPRGAAGLQGQGVPLEQVPSGGACFTAQAHSIKVSSSEVSVIRHKMMLSELASQPFFRGNKQQLKTTVNLTKPQVCPSEHRHVHTLLWMLLHQRTGDKQSSPLLGDLQLCIYWKYSLLLKSVLGYLPQKKVALRQEMG